MTAGFGWIGEINNQFNNTKGCPGLRRLRSRVPAGWR